MKRYFSSKNRPMHMGPYPLETLERAKNMPDLSAVPQAAMATFKDDKNPTSLINAMPKFVRLLADLRDGDTAANVAPLPEDPTIRAQTLKSWVYHEGLEMAGVTRIPHEAILRETATTDINIDIDRGTSATLKVGAKANKMFYRDSAVEESLYGRGQVASDREVIDKTYTEDELAGRANTSDHASQSTAAQEAFKSLGHTHALVILSAFTREVKPDEPGYAYINGSQYHRAAALALETALLIAGYLRVLGYRSRAHSPIETDLDLNKLVVSSGLGYLDVQGGAPQVVAPYIGSRFAAAVLSTNFEMTPDKPLTGRKTLRSHGPNYWFGFSGTKPGLKWGTDAARPLHTGIAPMDKIKKVDTPTSIIDEPNIPRVPKRHDMWIRAAHGDLGEKVAEHFAGLKNMLLEPYNHSTMRIIGGVVPLQDGPTLDDAAAGGTQDPKANADAIKALCTYLGGDIVSVCKTKPYMWYSHDHDGSEIEPYHENAIIVLADQGYDTMEGSSGDDYIAGAQATKGYRRSSLYTGIVAEQIRRLGYSARTHTVVDQDVLHVPMMLEGGVGEICRIGEMVLNPFLGARFKSCVITTDMPLAHDKPIDFGMQDFCNKCRKCARECPPGAISWGDKIMFNGYECWKQDTIRCTKYRATNPAGTSCGRCMKTCPWNREGVLVDAAFRWGAINFPFARKWLIDLDDQLNRGARNPVKKWWFDVIWRDGKAITPPKVNKRNLRKDVSIDPKKQRIAVFPADLAPPPGETGIVPIEDTHKEGFKRYREAERPEDYAKRMGLNMRG